MEQFVALFKPLENIQEDSLNNDDFTIFGPIKQNLFNLELVLELKIILELKF
jgi:hypothetical protein